MPLNRHCEPNLSRHADLSRHCERREAIHVAQQRKMDCFAALAMTLQGHGLLRGVYHRARIRAIRWLSKTRRVLLRAVAEMRPSRSAAPAEIERHPSMMDPLAG